LENAVVLEGLGNCTVLFEEDVIVTPFGNLVGEVEQMLLKLAQFITVLRLCLGVVVFVEQMHILFQPEAKLG
jgi:hypothetical protein